MFVPWNYMQGATSTNEKVIPEGAEQIFFMSKNISDVLKENLAWGTYVLLRNTKTVSVVRCEADCFSSSKKTYAWGYDQHNNVNLSNSVIFL